MAILNGLLNVNVYSDTNQTVFPEQLLPSLSAQFQDLNVTDVQTSYVALAALASQVISFNSVTPVSYLYIMSSAQDITVAINGGSALAYGYGVPGFMPLKNITSLTVTNASSTDSTNVTVVIIKG